MAPRAALKDYYRVLEVTQSATTKAVKESYKKLALVFQPDRKGKST